jgi:hypothetical protein
MYLYTNSYVYVLGPGLAPGASGHPPLLLRARATPFSARMRVGTARARGTACPCSVARTQDHMCLRLL